jgi:hypothetical protein
MNRNTIYKLAFNFYKLANKANIQSKLQGIIDRVLEKRGTPRYFSVTIDNLIFDYYIFELGGTTVLERNGKFVTCRFNKQELKNKIDQIYDSKEKTNAQKESECKQMLHHLVDQRCDEGYAIELNESNVGSWLNTELETAARDRAAGEAREKENAFTWWQNMYGPKRPHTQTTRDPLDDILDKYQSSTPEKPKSKPSPTGNSFLSYEWCKGQVDSVLTEKDRENDSKSNLMYVYIPFIFDITFKAEFSIDTIESILHDIGKFFMSNDFPDGAREYITFKLPSLKKMGCNVEYEHDATPPNQFSFFNVGALSFNVNKAQSIKSCADIVFVELAT